MAQPGPHAALQSSQGAYCYDARGNQIAGPNRSISYSVDNKPLVITSNGQASEFRYDPDHKRFYQSTPERSTYYLDEGQFEEVHANGQVLQNTYASGYLQHQKNLSSGTSSLKYKLNDQLGSVDVVLNAQGQVLERLAYAPFGGRRGANWSDNAAPMQESRRGFTGHEHLEESNLIHMNGRVYDPSLGRFLSADIVYQDATNAQMFNRYAYGFNSPFSGTDPTGYAWNFSWNSVLTSYNVFTRSVGSWFSGGLDRFTGTKVFSNAYNSSSGLFGAASGTQGWRADNGYRANVPVPTNYSPSSGAIGGSKAIASSVVQALAGPSGGLPGNAVSTMFAPKNASEGYGAAVAAKYSTEFSIGATLVTAGAYKGVGVLRAAPKEPAPLVVTEKAYDFFEGAYYSGKVKGQMAKGDLHSFPESVKGFQAQGAVRKITGGDGKVREQLEIPGSYYKTHKDGSNTWMDGHFEFMKEADGKINHRFFRENQ